MKPLLTAIAICAALLTPLEANAFCGFYVAKADAKLFNKASKVVVARQGQKTAITMASDYQGDLKEFALVVPVPTVIAKDQIRIADNATVDHLDAYTSPRLVEYFDPDPCNASQFLALAGVQRNSLRFGFSGSAKAPVPAAALGVKVEAEYTVGEYDIAILSAKESTGLQTYLDQEGYKVPPAANAVLASYIKQDMKFFVARVNLKEQAKSGAQYLRPIQIVTETPKFMLPIRLGTVNADGPQDMIVMMLTEKGRVETTNYKTIKIPSNMNVPVYTKAEFGNFYRAMFDNQVKRDGGKAVYLEYAWDMGWCDPCAADPVPNDKLVSLGASWLNVQPQKSTMPEATGGGRRSPAAIAPTPVFVTRLHVRYDAQSFPEDLMFQETADRSNFQGRYILRHTYTGKADCAQGEDYRRSLPARHHKEAAELSTLTGWTVASILEKMRANGQAVDR